MALLDWLFRRAPKIEDPLPPDSFIVTVTPAERGLGLMLSVELPEDSAHETDEPETPENEPLENLFCEIEYVDSKGAGTTRPVTMISLSRKHTMPSIVAVCHSRRAVRTFRADRIRNVITADGEVFDGQHFLTEVMKLDLTPREGTANTGIRPAPAKRPAPQITAKESATPRGRPKAPPSRDFRDLILAPLTVLVACGKSDGHFHPEEVDRIMIWAEREATRLHKANLIDADLSLDEANAMGKVIAGMRPQQRTLQQHMTTTLALEPERLARFRRALQEVIHADGLLHDQEVGFMAEFDRLAEAARSDPDSVVEEVAAASGTAIDTWTLPTVDLDKAVFVFTGKFVRFSRRQAVDAVEARNGTVKNHVDFAHEYYPGSCLVWGAGGGGGSKRQTALERGLPVISETEFLERIGLA